MFNFMLFPVATSDFSDWVPVGTVQYKFSDCEATFGNAVDACKDDGSQLITFDTAAQYIAFRNLSNL